VEPLKFPDDFPSVYPELVETAMNKNPDARYPNAVAMRNAFLTATGHVGADATIQIPGPTSPAARPEPSLAVPTPISPPNPTTERINRLAREASRRFRTYVRESAGVGGGAVGAPESAVSMASPAPPPVTPPAAPLPAAAVPATASEGGPDPARESGHRGRHGPLIPVLIVALVAIFALFGFFLTVTGRRTTMEFHRAPQDAPLPSTSRPGVRPPLPPRSSNGIVPAGLEGKDRSAPADEAEAAAKKRQLRQNLARLNRLVNEHGSVIKEFLDLMENVNLAEVLQQVRGKNDSR